MNNQVIVGKLTHSAYAYPKGSVVIMDRSVYEEKSKWAAGLIIEPNDKAIGYFFGNQVIIVLEDVQEVPAEVLSTSVLSQTIQWLISSKLQGLTIGDFTHLSNYIKF